MPSKHLAKMKQKHPRAYERWTAREDSLLREKNEQGMGIKDIAKLLQRQPSAIKSRLSKYEIIFPEEDVQEENLERNTLFDWVPVFQEEMIPYVFPNPITDYMKVNYRKPAIYRWVIEPGRNSNSLIYIGETVSLCPERLLGYLSPGPTQQTNNRINTLLHAHKYNKATIKFEMLRITGLFINDLTLNEKDLEEQEIRRIIEKFLISLYRSHGANLLNL